VTDHGRCTSVIRSAFRPAGRTRGFLLARLGAMEPFSLLPAIAAPRPLSAALGGRCGARRSASWQASGPGEVQAARTKFSPCRLSSSLTAAEPFCPPSPARGSARGASGAGFALFRRGGFVARHMAATARGAALRLCKARGKAVCTARGESFAFAPSIDPLSLSTA
jgi:hypothetical protein